jgi:WD40 repeat protein
MPLNAQSSLALKSAPTGQTTVPSSYIVGRGQRTLSASIVPRMQGDSHRKYATAHIDGSVLLWSTKPHVRPEIVSFHGGPVNSVSISQRKLYIASVGADRVIALYDLNTNTRVLRKSSHSQCIRSVAWSLSSLCITCSDDKSMRIWDTAEGCLDFKCCLRGHNNWVRTAVFDGSDLPRLVASGSDDRTVRVWDIARGKMVQTFQDNDSAISECCFLSRDFPDVIAAASWDKTVRLWDIRDSQMIQQYKSHDAPVNSICCHSSRNLLISADSNGQVKIGDYRQGRILWTLDAHKGPCNTVTADSISNQFVSCGDDGKTLMWTFDN